MKLPEPIESSGYFWLPEDSSNKFPGTLRISKSGRTTLELQGNSQALNDEDAIRFVGTIDGLRQVTLERCVCLSSSFSADGMSKWTFEVDLAFIGMQFNQCEEATFEMASFSIEGLDTWLDISGIQFNEGKRRSVYEMPFSIDFELPSPIELSLSEDFSLHFYFEPSLPPITFSTVTEATVKQKAYMYLEFNNPLPVEDIHSFILRIRNFFCFIMAQDIAVESLTVRTTRTQGNSIGLRNQKFPIPIQVYFESPHTSEHTPEIYRQHMLFSYADVKDEIETILKKWLESYERFKPTFDLYFISNFDPDAYIEVRFQSLTQGLESLHRRMCQETVMSDDEFNGIRDAVLATCPSDRKEWLEQRLNYANELSLRQRLNRLIGPFRDHFGNSQQRGIFVNRVVSTRNYLTHYDVSIENEAAMGRNLYVLCEKLDALLQLNLLRVIGFDSDSSIESILEGCTHLRRKLHLRIEEH